MHISNESLLVILVVGLVAGWLAGKIVRGAGFGLVGDLVIGIIGAFIGDWLLPRIGVHLGSGIISAIVNATIGAVLLLFVVGLLRGSFGGGWGEAGEDAVGGSGPNTGIMTSSRMRAGGAVLTMARASAPFDALMVE